MRVRERARVRVKVGVGVRVGVGLRGRDRGFSTSSLKEEAVFVSLWAEDGQSRAVPRNSSCDFEAGAVIITHTTTT